MKTLRLVVWLFSVLALALSCKDKKKPGPLKENFFPALSFIKSQVAHVDTSLYPIRKITYVDSTRSDTVFHKREEFRQLAADFLDIPDISRPEYKDRYTEEKIFDESLYQVILTYKPVKPENEEIQKQEVLIRPDPSGDRVTSIIIDYFRNSRDSSVQKRLLWKADKSFTVSITRQLPGQNETTASYKVMWNEDDQ